MQVKLLEFTAVSGHRSKIIYSLRLYLNWQCARLPISGYGPGARVAMRVVNIVYDHTDKRHWVAIDSENHRQLLRLHDRDQLLRTCSRLGWEVGRAEQPPETKQLQRDE